MGKGSSITIKNPLRKIIIFTSLFSLIVLAMGSNPLIVHAASPPAINEYPIPLTPGAPRTMVAGPGGMLWFVAGQSIATMTTAGAFQDMNFPTTPPFSPPPNSSGFTSYSSNAPTHLTLGPDGNIWFTTTDSNTVGKITPQGAVTQYYIPVLNPGPNPVSTQPDAISAGPDGRLWFTEDAGQEIGAITTDGVITQYPLLRFAETAGGAGGSTNSGIVSGPDGKMWFTDPSNGYIDNITTSGNITEYQIPITSAGWCECTPTAITVGSDNNLWVADNYGFIDKVTTSGTITEYPLPSNTSPYYSSPSNLTAAPDGNIWFTEYNGTNYFGAVGSISPSGSVSEYATPTQYSNPWGITTGADGNVWFAESGQNYYGTNYSIGKIDMPGNFTPTISGVTNSGSRVIITGTNLGGVTGVNFGSTPGGNITVTSPVQITVDPPRGIGTVPITVTSPGGTSPVGPPSQYNPPSGNGCASNLTVNQACATVNIGAGSLIRLNAPDVNYAAVSLNGQAQITNANVAYQVKDATGSGNGWNMTLSATTFTDLSNAAHTLPDNALSLNAPSGQVCVTPGCTVATDSVGGPIAVVTAPNSGPTLKILNATANTGMGSVETDTSTSLAIPASAYQGSYSSTWTLSLTSGP